MKPPHMTTKVTDHGVPVSPAPCRMPLLSMRIPSKYWKIAAATARLAPEGQHLGVVGEDPEDVVPEQNDDPRQTDGIVRAQLVGLAAVTVRPVSGSPAPIQLPVSTLAAVVSPHRGMKLNESSWMVIWLAASWIGSGGAHEDREHQEAAHVDEAFPGGGQAHPDHVGDGPQIRPAHLVDARTSRAGAAPGPSRPGPAALTKVPMLVPMAAPLTPMAGTASQVWPKSSNPLQPKISHTSSTMFSAVADDAGVHGHLHVAAALEEAHQGEDELGEDGAQAPPLDVDVGQVLDIQAGCGSRAGPVAVPAQT